MNPLCAWTGYVGRCSMSYAGLGWAPLHRIVKSGEKSDTLLSSFLNKDTPIPKISDAELPVRGIVYIHYNLYQCKSTAMTVP
jgi:hypothetical protein